MILYITRHAWAGRFGDPDWPDDFERPLTNKGQARFAEVVLRLVERGYAPEIVATSPVVRCRQTAEIIVDGLPHRPDRVELDELKPGSDLEGLLRWTAAQAGEHRSVAWVGHAPDVGRLTASLIGQPGGWIRFAKAATAAIRFYDAPEPGAGELNWLVTAKMLGC
ncbi:MAG: histidine phosphatase family protein [Pirellulales bacterium]|nr:histidine phosphatase family protein [Pirellulales bacterium]